jgi:hypothetical protein
MHKYTTAECLEIRLNSKWNVLWRNILTEKQWITLESQEVTLELTHLLSPKILIEEDHNFIT